MILHIDFETRSGVDLRKCGADVYARDKSTDVLCMGWVLDDEDVSLWTPKDPFPKKLIDALSDPKTKIVAHNFSFEFAVWNYCLSWRYGLKPIPIDQGYCTMSMAYAMALPGSLEKAAAAMGLSEQKDLKGNRVMLQLSQPRDVLPGGEIVWWEDQEKFEKLYAYCRQDVEVERQLYKRLMDLSSRERKIWQFDQRINQRGILVDLPAVEAAIQIAEFERERLDQAMKHATQNQVSTCNATKQLTEWLTGQGIKCEGVAKADILELLKTELPEAIKSVLTLRQEAAKSSVAKLEAMKNRTCGDGRLRGTTQYHGASTGRWAGRGLQVHNLPRGKLSLEEFEEVFTLLGKDFETVTEARDTLDIVYGSPLSVVSDCLRGFLIASPGHDLIACDFSAIEARVIAWLAGEEKVLSLFREDKPIYEHAASEIYRVPVSEITKDQRQIGKVAVLALGFQGGKVAFQNMARNYGLKVSDSEADFIKEQWRSNHPAIVRFWQDLEVAATEAVLHPGKTYNAGAKGRECRYKAHGSFLWCCLPSGRVICYPYPKIEPVETPWGALKDTLTYKSEGLNRQWEKQKAYGGLLAENVTQAVARDVLADAMLRLEDSGYPVVMHIHDEVVCEIPENFGSTSEMISIMVASEPWAKDLPINGNAFRAKRYRK